MNRKTEVDKVKKINAGRVEPAQRVWEISLGNSY